MSEGDEKPRGDGDGDEAAVVSERPAPSEPPPPRGPGRDRPEGDEDEDAGGLDEVDVRDLLRGALRPPPGAVAPDLLRGVQRRLRVRSRGKFYGDGWSTARSPRSTYLVTSLLMLIMVGFIFLVLIPWSGGALP